jgi:hypothetical protein
MVHHVNKDLKPSLEFFMNIFSTLQTQAQKKMIEGIFYPATPMNYYFLKKSEKL